MVRQKNITCTLFLPTHHFVECYHSLKEGFAPIGQVLSAGKGYGGMSVVDGTYSNYYEKPYQWKIEQEGEVYLNKMFPLLSYFINAEFVEE